jgi:predicted MPP superfamily phosphohydrolase
MMSMFTRLRTLALLLVIRQPIAIVVAAALLSAAAMAGIAGLFTVTGRRQGAHSFLKIGTPLSLTLLVFALLDCALLLALPYLGISFSNEFGVPLIVSFLVRLAIYWELLGASLLARWQEERRGKVARPRSAIIFFLVVNLAFSAVQFDAYVVEPLWVDTTKMTLASEDLNPNAPPVRIVHLTDPHIERNSHREATVVRKVNALHPDIIVLTGDYLNLSNLSDPVSAAHFRQFVNQLEAPYGIYAVRGSVDSEPRMAQLVDGTNVTWLEQEAVTIDVRGQVVTVVGVACSHHTEIDAVRLDQAITGIPSDAFTLLLYHSPDLIAEAVARDIDLYLGGHTHGGQIRLPIYGAIITNSQYGKRYESGLFEEGDTTMYINRGIGFEGGSMPRARFLCRPEIAVFDLEGSE